MLSETVAHALRDEGHMETADFVQNMDKFFDCLNVTSITGGKKKLKKFSYPYRSASDFRLEVRLIYIHTYVHVHVHVRTCHV